MSYGTSFELDDNFDLKFDPNKNCITMINGIPNCVQALIILLKTMKGEVRFYPDFGVDIPQLMDKNISDDNIKHAIRDAVIRDPRIKTIDKVEISKTDQGRTLNIYVKVTTYDGAILEFKQDAVW